jgi:Protein kinase domain
LQGAVDFIHSNGVIHCDIHTNNLLLDSDLDIRVCDFQVTCGDLDGKATESVRSFLPKECTVLPTVGVEGGRGCGKREQPPPTPPNRPTSLYSSPDENSFFPFLSLKNGINPGTTKKKAKFVARSNMPFPFSSESKLSLLDFAAQEESYALKREKITTAREIEDTERHTNRKGEDEKYNITLAKRRREDESMRMKRETEDNLLREIEKMIEDKELASDHKTLQCTQN